MKQYLDLAKLILSSDESVIKDARNGATISRFGAQMRFNLQDGFPLLTTKKMHLRSIIHENIWFLSGNTNIKYLKDNNVRIWDEWADENGDLGRVYGAQWRDWTSKKGNNVDQIKETIDNLTKNPFSRRHIITAWNPAEIDEMNLPPCHMMYQFYVREVEGEKFLDVQLYQRSGDMFLGVPFNIASYAMLDMMFAQVLGMKPGYFIHTLGDHHFYVVDENHADFYKENFSLLKEKVYNAKKSQDYLDIKNWIQQSVKMSNGHDHIPLILEQMSRTPKYLPTMELNSNVKSIDDFVFDDFQLKNYDYYPPIKGKVTE